MSARINHLTNANFQKKWLAVDETGELTLIRKDCRILRFVKALLGFITCHNFYSHINRSHVTRTIISLAKREKNSLDVDNLIHLASRIGMHDVATPAILDAHPEMVAQYSSQHSCYSVPAETTIDTTGSNAALIERCSELTKSVFGSPVAGGAGANDPRWKILYALIQNNIKYPTDQHGNYWIASQAHFRMKAKVALKDLGAIQGPWWKLRIPKTAGTYPLEERVIYIKEPGTLQLTAQKVAEVVIENQSADIHANGTVHLPNGRTLALHSKDNIFVNSQLDVFAEVIPYPLIETESQSNSFPICP
jgi:hypothetical protein